MHLLPQKLHQNAHIFNNVAPKCTYLQELCPKITHLPMIMHQNKFIFLGNCTKMLSFSKEKMTVLLRIHLFFKENLPLLH